MESVPFQWIILAFKCIIGIQWLPLETTHGSFFGSTVCCSFSNHHWSGIWDCAHIWWICTHTILKLATLTEFQIGDIEEMSWFQFEDKRAASWALGIFFIFVVTLIWSFASFLTQFIYADLNFRYYEYKTSFWHVCYDSFEFTRSPFILTYISR